MQETDRRFTGRLHAPVRSDRIGQRCLVVVNVGPGEHRVGGDVLFPAWRKLAGGPGPAPLEGIAVGQRLIAFVAHARDERL